MTGDRFVSAPKAMADQEAPRRGVRRAAAKADREAENRRVRQRLDEMETRLDWSESVGRSHEQRISFQESPQRIVLRGFACVPEFFRTRGGDFKVAKRAFIGGFVHELREKCGAEVNHLLDEAEGLLAERDGWGVLGVYPTGGMWGDVPDGLLRLQPGYVGDRVRYLLCMSSRSLQDSHQMFQDRVRKPEAKGKGKDKGKKGGKGKGKGKHNGPQPKRAAVQAGGFGD